MTNYLKTAIGFVVGAASAFVFREFLVLKTKDREQENQIADLNERVADLADVTNETFQKLSTSMIEDLQSLSENVGTDMHEIVKLIADSRFGDEGE